MNRSEPFGSAQHKIWIVSDSSTGLYIWTFKTDNLEVNPDVGRGVSCRFRDCRGGGGGRAGQASRGWQCGAAALCNAQSLGMFCSMLQRLCKILGRSCKLKPGSSKKNLKIFIIMSTLFACFNLAAFNSTIRGFVSLCISV